LSITLDALFTETRVVFRQDLADDDFSLNGQRTSRARSVSRSGGRSRQGRRQLPRSRHLPQQFSHWRGLASSASGFAAWLSPRARPWPQAVAGRALDFGAAGFRVGAALALGGFVEMHAGRRDDGADAVAARWPI